MLNSEYKIMIPLFSKKKMCIYLHLHFSYKKVDEKYFQKVHINR